MVQGRKIGRWTGKLTGSFASDRGAQNAVNWGEPVAKEPKSPYSQPRKVQESRIRGTMDPFKN